MAEAAGVAAGDEVLVQLVHVRAAVRVAGALPLTLHDLPARTAFLAELAGARPI